MTEFKLALKIGDLKDDEVKHANAGSLDIAVIKKDGKIFALSGKCTHKGGPLADGTVSGGNLICPWHGGAFDVDTGKASADTPWVTDLDTYKVRVDSTTGDIYVVNI